MSEYPVYKYVRLKEHNSYTQMRYGGHGFADTRNTLKVGQTYKVGVIVKDWHTEYHIEGDYYNSVCFEDIDIPELQARIKELEEQNRELTNKLKRGKFTLRKACQEAKEREGE